MNNEQSNERKDAVKQFLIQLTEVIEFIKTHMEAIGKYYQFIQWNKQVDDCMQNATSTTCITEKNKEFENFMDVMDSKAFDQICWNLNRQLLRLIAIRGLYVSSTMAIEILDIINIQYFDMFSNATIQRLNMLYNNFDK